MDVRLVQVSLTDDEPVLARVERVCALVREQRGADLVVLPELWAAGAWALDEWPNRTEPLDGPFFQAVSAAARDTGCVLHAGSFLEQTDGPRGRANTSLLLDRDGSLVQTYRKLHLFGFAEGEPLLVDAGAEVVVATTSLGALGLATCYDLRFPELFRQLVDSGAEVIVLPSSWPAKRATHWTLLAQARAIEDQLFVLACNAAGTHGGVPQAGRSLVVSPTGEVLAEAGEGEEVLAVEIDLAEVARWREAFPVLGDRRL